LKSKKKSLNPQRENCSTKSQDKLTPFLAIESEAKRFNGKYFLSSLLLTTNLQDSKPRYIPY
ncbi:hypothetical protein, partial [Francisella tularensis]|uniref:hypothetical protein n=1 Tax=Francisella tularensis TaxID=263 RepID=UPI00238199F3